MDERQKKLLLECVHDFTVLDDQQQLEYDSLIQSPRFQKVYDMHKNMFDVARDVAREEGIQEGRLEGERTVLLSMLERKFGEVPARVRTKITRLDTAQITQLAGDLLSAERLSELKF